jgi:hypothetical protein
LLAGLVEVAAGVLLAAGLATPFAAALACSASIVRSMKLRRQQRSEPHALAVLPPLPDDIEYRLVAQHLIFLDIRARLVVDRMTFAVRC